VWELSTEPEKIGADRLQGLRSEVDKGIKKRDSSSSVGADKNLGFNPPTRTNGSRTAGSGGVDAGENDF